MARRLAGRFIANAWDIFSPGDQFALSQHLVFSTGIAVGSALQPLVGAWLLRRWIGTEGIFAGARSAFKFAGITLLACLIAATVGATMLAVTGFAPWSRFGFAWWTWWVGDIIGILIVTPLILSWNQPASFPLDRRRLMEAAVLVTLMLGVALFVFGEWELWNVVAGTLTYLTVPLLVWSTFRFGAHGATAGLLLVSKIAVWGTAHGHGPFVQPTLNESLLLLQTFVGVLAVTTLALAGVLAERQRAEQARAGAILQLERALQEIKTLRGLIPICAWCKKIRNDAGMWEQLEAYLRSHTEANFSHGICPDCLDKRGLLDPQADRKDAAP